MSVVADAASALKAALEGVDGLRVYTDPGALVDPPAAVIGPPSLTWGGYCTGPDEATFHVYTVTAFDDRSLSRLWDLVPLVAAAVDTVPDAAVTRADAGTYSTGGVDLPSYDLQVDVSL